MRDRLSDVEIQRALGKLPGWSRKGDTISKTYQFKTFPEGIAFDIRYTKVTLALSTHTANGVTQMDLDLAGQIEGLAG